MRAKNATKTEIKILFRVVSKDARKRHDQWATSFIGPVGFDRCNIGELTASKQRRDKHHKNQHDGTDRISKGP